MFSELFYWGQFAVPWHQRYYDWTPRDVRALLDDIYDAVEEDRACYFLGAIMLVDDGSHNRWEINDGQQRMVTMSLICAVLCRRFHNISDSQRESLALRALFVLNPMQVCSLDDTENYTPRISPPKNDTMRYRQMIRGNTIGSNGTLTTVWREIDRFFSSMSSKQLKRYFDFLLRNVEIAWLKIPSHIDPNAVYETINCRGKKLDDLDLIRNYLYSHFNLKEESERRVSVHDNLEKFRTRIDKANKASEYMRCYLQCRFGFLRKDNFYRDVREAIRNRGGSGRIKQESMADYVFNLTEQITSSDALELFIKIASSNPESEFVEKFKVCSGTTNSPRNLAVFLRELRGYTVTQPLVFAILIRYIRETDGRKKKRIARIANRNISRLATFVLRTAFVSPKFEPSHFETEFSNYAKDIIAAADIPDTEFARFLMDCDQAQYGVLHDPKFQKTINDVKMTGATKIKQFLLGINRHIQKDTALFNERLCSIEHILPKSPQHWGGWHTFDNVDANDWIHRIGNLTLIGPMDNKPGAKFNSDFVKKCENYKDSGVKLTRDLIQHSDWSPANIEARQCKMAKRAVQVWTFS